uniref:Ig-like domain-containing protein n=1 Tax=Oreochromis aureus TaxID=47969 RepID=A0AAZ1XWX4_OREAU
MLDCYETSLLIIMILTGVSCQQLTANKTEESSLEGSTVTLSYRYSRQATGNDQFYWYRQYPGKPPEFLIFNLGTQNTTNSKLSVRMVDDRNGLNLQISSAAVTDSAVYYCAVSSYLRNKEKEAVVNIFLIEDIDQKHQIHQLL